MLFLYISSRWDKFLLLTWHLSAGVVDTETKDKEVTGAQDGYIRLSIVPGPQPCFSYRV